MSYNFPLLGGAASQTANKDQVGSREWAKTDTPGTQSKDKREAQPGLGENKVNQQIYR